MEIENFPDLPIYYIYVSNVYKLYVYKHKLKSWKIEKKGKQTIKNQCKQNRKYYAFHIYRYVAVFNIWKWKVVKPQPHWHGTHILISLGWNGFI